MPPTRPRPQVQCYGVGYGTMSVHFRCVVSHPWSSLVFLSPRRPMNLKVLIVINKYQKYRQEDTETEAREPNVSFTWKWETTHTFSPPKIGWYTRERAWLCSTYHGEGPLRNPTKHPTMGLTLHQNLRFHLVWAFDCDSYQTVPILFHEAKPSPL